VETLSDNDSDSYLKAFRIKIFRLGSEKERENERKKERKI